MELANVAPNFKDVNIFENDEAFERYVDQQLLPLNEVDPRGLEETLDASAPCTHQNKVNITHAKTTLAEITSNESVRREIIAPSTPAISSMVGAKETYPTLPLDLTHVSHDQLMSEISKITSLYRKTKNYFSIRDDFVYTSLALNQFALLAPVFRDQPRIPSIKKERNDSHDQLLIDQIVIDCHWLRSRGEQVSVCWHELKGIFDLSVIFDCSDIAERIASKGWSSDFKVSELFTLSTRQQVQLMQLRSNKLKDQYRILIDGKQFFDAATRAANRTKPLVSMIRSEIINWADRNHRIRGQEEMYIALWLAGELLGKDASYSKLADLAALRCGVKPLHPKTVSDKVSQLNKMLVSAGA